AHGRLDRGASIALRPAVRARGHRFRRDAQRDARLHRTAQPDGHDEPGGDRGRRDDRAAEARRGADDALPARELSPFAGYEPFLAIFLPFDPTAYHSAPNSLLP